MTANAESSQTPPTLVTELRRSPVECPARWANFRLWRSFLLDKSNRIAFPKHQPSLPDGDDVFVLEPMVADRLVVDKHNRVSLWNYRITAVFPPDQSVLHGYVPVVVKCHIASFVSPDGNDGFVNDELSPFHPT